MAYMINVPALSPISPEDYLADFIARGDPRDDACVIEYGEKLGAVTNNKQALIDRINAEVVRWRDGFSAMYTQGSMLLAGRRGEDAYLRVNFWPTISQDAPDREKLSLVYSYGIPHDHGFSFVTTNYFGPGYTTDLYNYEYESTSGVVGEPVCLLPAGTVTLSDGVGLYFKAGRDIHVQHPPSALTVSLNLMIYRKGDRSRDQFYFDLAARRVSSFAAGALCVRRKELVKLAAIAGDATTTDLLLGLASSYPCRTTRRAAVIELLSTCRVSPAEFCPSLVNDEDPVIRDLARRANVQ